MPPSQPNVVVFVSDEHAARYTGCYDHDVVETPNIDQIADRGAQFSRTYCPSPICVPSRLSFLTGQYPHQIGGWDNGATLPAAADTWGDRLDSYETVLCGRGDNVGDGCRDRAGFDRRLLDDPERWKNHLEPDAPSREISESNRRSSRSHVTDCGVDEDHWHLAYDRTVARYAADFITRRGPDESPWLLYVGTMNPHFPLRAPNRLRSRYDSEDLDLAATHDEPIADQHSFIQQIRRRFRNDTPLDETVERRALASYYALITFVDELVGQVYEAVDASGQVDDTVFCYTSDHGEMAGHHGHWQKHCLYDPATRVPLVLSGPGVPRTSVEMNSSLVDLAPTWVDVAGQDPADELPGESLLRLAQSAAANTGETRSSPRDDAGRSVLSEYHAMGSTAGAYMLARGDYKYVHYVDHDPQLFDIAADPNETTDLIDRPEYVEVRERLDAELRSLLDPQAVDADAKADQRRRREIARE